MWKAALSLAGAVMVLLGVWGLGVAFGEDAKNVRKIPELQAVVDDLVKIHEAEEIRRQEQAKAAAARAELCAEAAEQGVVLKGCPRVPPPVATGPPETRGEGP